MLIGVENVSVVAVDEIGNRGDDALLVDRYTGQVVQVVRDVFW